MVDLLNAYVLCAALRRKPLKQFTVTPHLTYLWYKKNSAIVTHLH